MECADDYLNVENQLRSGERKRGKRQAGMTAQKSDCVQGKQATLIGYFLLGASILLSVILLVRGVTLISMMTEELRNSHTQLMMLLSELNSRLPHPVDFCKSSTFNQKCYHFSTTKTDWWSAQDFCTSKMSTLVVINSVEEQTFLEKRINATSHWIGFTDLAAEGDWRWVDGTNYSSSVTFWKSDEPNNSGKGEHCAMMLVDGKWNDISCDKNFKFICEKPMLY